MKTIKVLIITILLLVFVCPLRASAEETGAEVIERFDEILDDSEAGYSYSEVSGITFGSLVEKLRERVPDGGRQPLKLLGSILLVTVLCALVRSTGGSFINNADSIFNSVGALAAVMLILPHLLELFGRAVRAVELSGSFVAVFIPVFAGITAASGGLAAAGVYDISLLAASELIVQLSAGYLMPIVSASTVLSVTGSVFTKSDLSGIVRLIKKLITWGMTIVMTLFTGFLTLKCTLAGKMDGAATKTARLVISGFVPVVGGAVSDAYATVRSSFDIVRGTVGTGGCIAIVLLLLPTVVQILLMRVVMWTGSAAAELLGENSMKKLLGSLDSGLAIAQSVLVCYGVMFVLCTGIMMRSAG
ncbi:MAG: stage III sporulation protein AE [Ruminococcus sp.]|uniref:stage III sporulation protein AE n=1 Tax=Ruminococcus sp. TaxID=41978 RepID=UPI0025EF8B12|nr:hypothetical protein [Ruminococcus sp.]MCR5599374.1 stage III sporulation protein AE [Ruminococcus sp.]